MQKVFSEVASLDRRCCEKFFLNEELLMEHAANGMAKYIQNAFTPNSKVLIITGSGDNGADGYALARMLHLAYKVKVLEFKSASSKLALLQKKRALSVGVEFVDMVVPCDVAVDAIFGSGLNRVLDETAMNCLSKLNSLQAFKIACDIPSGLMNSGRCSEVVFKADVTLTMGALKSSLYSDDAKVYVGKIEVVDLGVSRGLYETHSPMYLLERDDMKLPYRTQVNTHKGNFGHAVTIAGSMQGAAILAARATQVIGSGLSTIVTKHSFTLPETLMRQDYLPQNITALCLGMGLGNSYEKSEILSLLRGQNSVLDADILCDDSIEAYLAYANVITPHPKEFCTLLGTLNLAHIDTQTLQASRFEYAQLFSRHFPKVVLVLKGANVLIAFDEEIYINTFGSATLSKGGSGDVLSGLITGLLAQGYTPLQAAITGDLAHTLALEKITKSNFAVTPLDLLEAVGRL